METKQALKKQYHSALKMLKIAIERCPEDFWIARDHPRAFWRIAFHVLFYTHLYLQTQEAEFVPWENHRDDNANLWEDPWQEGAGPVPYTKQEILDYWNYCDSIVDEQIDKIDLDSPNSGFDWYPIPKYEHQLVNLRHIQGHVGQLSELLMQIGIDIDWVGSIKN